MPFTYLGLPMGSTRSTIADLVPVVDSAERKLSSSLCMLNQGSKLTLLNSLLTSIAIFPLCTIKFPPKLVDHLDKIRRRCLWRKKTERGETCNSLALWDLVCRPKNHGGLGVLDVKVRNLALLLKFLHSFYKKKDVPWANLIWSMYYVDKVPHATDPCGSFWWRDVMQLSDTYGGIMTGGNFCCNQQIEGEVPRELDDRVMRPAASPPEMRPSPPELPWSASACGQG